MAGQRICSNCGTANPAERDFCTNCGAFLWEGKPPDPAGQAAEREVEPIAAQAAAPWDDRPPDPRPLKGPLSYRDHIAEVMTRSHELALLNKRRGDRFALAAILLAFASSAVGFLTAALDTPLIGIVAGIIAAGAGAVGAWVRRGQYDALAAANRQLTRGLQRELRLYDGRVGAYAPEPGETPPAARTRAYKLFVDRCEQLSTDAEVAVTSSGGESP